VGAVHRAEVLREDLVAFAPYAETSSLYLIRAIERTLDSLHSEEEIAHAVAAKAVELTKRIKGAPVFSGHYLDPNDESIDFFETGYKALEERLPALLTKKSAIDHDRQLGEDHCETLRNSYDRAIDAVASLIEALKDLRAAIITYDLAAEPKPSEQYDSAGALIQSLHT
jgi:hypothetical protein